MGAAALLTILKDGEVVKKQNLEGEADVGRADGCVIRLEDRAISRQHALFRPVGDGFQVEKKSDYAPLMVNGTECTRAFLKEGDVIAIGPYQVKYSRADAPAGATAHPVDPGPAMNQLVSPFEAPTEMVAPEPAVAEDPTSTAARELREAAGVEAPEPMTKGFGMDLGGGQAGSDPGMLAPPVGEGSMLLNMDGGGAMTPSEGEEGATKNLGEAGGGINLSNPNLDMTGDAGGMSLSNGPVDQEASTKVFAAGDLKAKLMLKSGAASATEVDIEGDEVSIGRGRDCTIIVDDKKVSRKNTIITRKGNVFTIKDLESANGTHVNGLPVKEAQLFGDDVVKIGNTEFKFVALSENYEKRQDEFAQVAAAGAPEGGTNVGGAPDDLEVPEINLPPPVDGGSPSFNMGGASNNGGPAELNIPSTPDLMGGGFTPPPPREEMTNPGLRAPVPGMSGLYPAGGFGQAGASSGLANTRTINVMGIPGLPGAGPAPGKQDKGIMAKFRRLNKRQQYIAIAIVIALGWTLLWDDEDLELPKGPKKTVVKKVDAKTQPNAAAVPVAPPGVPTFDTLSPEKKRLVESQHNLAFDYYRNKDYAKALFEIQKIFDIIPDYKDSREIERYSQEGKRKQDAIEEEKRKKEEEIRLKQKIAGLVDDAATRMKKKQYDQAREIFSQLLALDPENTQVPTWKKEIEDFEEMQKLAVQEKVIQKEISDRAWDVYKRGMTLKRQARYHTAIVVFGKIAEDGAASPRLAKLAAKMIRACKGIIAGRRGPLLAQGAAAEKNGEFIKAMRLYGRAWQVDPGHPAAIAGMNRVKKILHERAKVMYTEAVLAESYSDFETAKAKYKEILTVAPQDDLYYERAQRKVGRYFQRGIAQEP